MTDNAGNANKGPDVLNSIRQLMADRESASAVPGRDKLVLTDAQRVPSASRARDVADEVDRITQALSRRAGVTQEATPDPAPSLLSELKSAAEAQVASNPPAPVPSRPENSPEPETTPPVAAAPAATAQTASPERTACAEQSPDTETATQQAEQAAPLTQKPSGITLDDKIAALEKILGTQRPRPAPAAEPTPEPATRKSSRASNVIRLVHSSDKPPAGDAVTYDDLRTMVAEILREELQGVLGEKITGNMRKMVRREIQRAIMDRDLD